MTSAIAVTSPYQSSTAPTVRRLENGLTVIAQQMPVEAVNLSLWFRVGSAMEADAINGMAHFLEHMIFKGTAHLPTGEFERRVEARGTFNALAIRGLAAGNDAAQASTTSTPTETNCSQQHSRASPEDAAKPSETPSL